MIRAADDSDFMISVRLPQKRVLLSIAPWILLLNPIYSFQATILRCQSRARRVAMQSTPLLSDNDDERERIDRKKL